MSDIYPTLDHVEVATPVILSWWYRFLPSPGLSHIETSNFSQMFRHEIVIMDRIIDRLNKSGGITPIMSKTIGFEMKYARICKGFGEVA